jgi:hypothetical protein
MEFTGSTLSVNIYGEIAFNDGTILKIPSNITWAVRNVDGIKPYRWIPAKDIGKPPMFNGEIFPPNLAENRGSWISRKFGERGYKESILSIATKSHFLARLIASFEF